MTVFECNPDESAGLADEQLGAPRCPTCDRVMSGREASEQGSCNDCYGDAGYTAPADLGSGRLTDAGYENPRHFDAAGSAYAGDPELGYVLFTNLERTRFVRCWPTSTENEWRVERASRDHEGDTWGPPETRAIVGTLDDLIRHYANRGYVKHEIVSKPPDRIPVQHGFTRAEEIDGLVTTIAGSLNRLTERLAYRSISQEDLAAIHTSAIRLAELAREGIA